MISYIVHCEVGKPMGGPMPPPDDFPIGSEVEVIKEFNVDDHRQDQTWSVGVTAIVISHRQDGVDIRRGDTTIVVGKALHRYFKLKEP